MKFEIATSSRNTQDRPKLLKSFYPALDGLRACAFLAVFMDHYVSHISAWRIFPWGWVGVDLFFVMSGFLITGILFDSLPSKDYFRSFYTRRALRIFPLYYAFWFTLLLLTPLFHFHWNRANATSFVYLQNFVYPAANMGLCAQPGHVDFHIRFLSRYPQFVETTTLWSLCVEEHFYLIWPAVVFIIRSRQHLLNFCLLFIMLFPLARGVYVHLWPELLASGALYVSSYSRADSLLVGAALALWLRGNPLPLVTMRFYAVLALAVCPLVLTLLLSSEKSAVGDGHVDPIVSTVGFSLIAFASAGLLLLALEADTLFARVLQLRPLAALGRISYGMYFFHGLFTTFLFARIPSFRHHHLTVMMPVTGFLLTLLLAVLSFHYLESPLLQLKDRWAPVRGRKPDPTSDVFIAPPLATSVV